MKLNPQSENDPAVVKYQGPTNILVRLRGYNPPDRTVDAERQIAVDIHDAADEIERLTEQAADAEADVLRLHGDKMAYFEAALALVHSETIKSVCGWYPEVEAFRKLLGMAAHPANLPTDEAVRPSMSEEGQELPGSPNPPQEKA